MVPYERVLIGHSKMNGDYCFHCVAKIWQTTMLDSFPSQKFILVIEWLQWREEK